METFLLLLITFFIAAPFILIYLIIKKIIQKSDEKKQQIARQNKYVITFPDPNITNEYRFFKFLEEKSTFIIENWYKEALNRNFTIPEKYKQAIEQKIRYGEFNNPHKFSTFFDKKFDIISVYHLPASYTENDYNQLRFCFIQNDQIASVETFYIGAPLSLDDNTDGYRVGSYLHFSEYWYAYGLDKYLNDNLLAFRQEDFHYFYKLIKKSDFSYNFDFIIIEEVLRDKKLHNASFENTYLKTFPKKTYDKNNPYQLVELIYELIDDEISELAPFFHKLENDSKTD